MRSVTGLAALCLLVLTAACGGQDDGSPARSGYTFPQAPAAPDVPLEPRVAAAIDKLLPEARVGVLDLGLLETIAGSGDSRLAWLVSDLLRFYQASRVEEAALVDAFEQLTGVDPRGDPLFAAGSWRTVTDHLLAWDTPAPPGYRQRKGVLHVGLEPQWTPFFADPDSDIDWRRVAWGGVLIDDRELGDPEICFRGCIPALDDPALTPADEGNWYPDERIVFGVALGGEAVAFPKNIMEVHEMVNVTIGGRRLGIPYCTLCASAQAYVTAIPERRQPLVLRTTGLLQRSNKLMYDLDTKSAIDTFTGRALSGPLHDAGVVLDQVTVVTSTWGEWKVAHPETRIVARDGGIGRTYDDDPLRGRDDGGPIFPIGDVDGRLPVQTKVVGVVVDDGTPVAFPVLAAREALRTGETVELAGIELVADGGGLRVAGGGVAAHEAFWFAWSQFYPETELWRG
jgi:hypothetical protein